MEGQTDLLYERVRPQREARARLEIDCDSNRKVRRCARSFDIPVTGRILTVRTRRNGRDVFADCAMRPATFFGGPQHATERKVRYPYRVLLLVHSGFFFSLSLSHSSLYMYLCLCLQHSFVIFSSLSDAPIDSTTTDAAM